MRFRMMCVIAIATAATVLTSSTATAAQTTAVTPVPSVDLDRYQGRWVQVAAIPQPFQAQCARNDSAVYDVLPNGQVSVLNSCTRADGTVSALEGRARSAVPGSTSRLEVSFFKDATGEWNFDRPGTYWIIGLDRDYQWAVVGAPDRRSGFVLNRTPNPSPAAIARIGAVLLRNGYNPCAFSITAQDGGAPQGRPLCALPTETSAS